MNIRIWDYNMNIKKIKKKTCKECGKLYSPTNYRQMYCSRNCFRINYTRRLNINKFPIYKCGHCGTETKLDFSPKRDLVKWEAYCCPECGYNNKKG